VGVGITLNEDLCARTDSGGSCSRLSRLLNLTQLLNSGLRRNARELGELLGVSRRTIFRDIQALQGAGVPLVYDSATQTYRIQKIVNCDFGLNVSDVLSFAIATSAAKVNSRLKRAVTLFEVEYSSHLGPTARSLFQSAVEWVQNERCVPVETAPGDQIQTLFKGYFSRTKVRIVYQNPDDEPQGTLLSPHALVLTNGGIEVSGWSSFHRKAVRIEMSKIASAEATEEEFSNPDRGFSC